MAEEIVKKAASKTASNSKMWIGGLVVVIVILLGVNFVYMKQIRDAKAKASSGSMDNGMGGDLADKPLPKVETSTTDMGANIKQPPTTDQPK